MDETVSMLCAAYCARIDAAHPSCLAGLYLVGSVALDDFRPGSSDVDFIAVLDRPLGVAEARALHHELQEQFVRPHFDGIYLDAGALTQDPRTIEPGLSVIDGVVRGPGHEERHPVSWLTLARHGIAVRGPAPSTDWVWNDVRAAQEYSRENLASYWKRVADRHRSQLGSPAILSDADVAWSVLGVGRLHAMITAGLLLSKGQSAAYALAVFPAHRTIITEAKALRLGKHPMMFGTPQERAKAMVDFLDTVIADGRGRSA